MSGGFGENGVTGIDFTVINQTPQDPVLATITVTPILENQGTPCFGSSVSFTVLVNGVVEANADISDFNGFNISCFGANDGFININPIGGSPFNSTNDYEIEWSGPIGFTSNELNISELGPGEYNLTITDSLGCPFEFQYILTEPEPLSIQTDSALDIICNGFDTDILITPQGGVGPYTYVWTYDNGSGGELYSSAEDLIGITEPGTYVLILNDSNGCGPVTEVFEISEPDPIEYLLDSQVNVLCHGDSTGSIELTITGGTQIEDGSNPYIYSWNGPGSYTSNDEDIFGLAAGVYELTVTDEFDCQEIFSFEITQPEDLILSYETEDISCFGFDDGAINLTISGGVEPYQIVWSNLGNGLNQNNLSPGVYDVTITDANGCVEEESIEIFEAPTFETNPVITQISCFGENDGSIELNITGGIPPYTVLWDDDPSAGIERNNLSQGNYSVTIFDSSSEGCTITDTFIIVEPQELVLNSIITQPTDCDNVNSGTIDLQVIGGTPPYSFIWSNGDISEDLVDVPAGSYSVVVSDSRNCEVSSEIFDLIRPAEVEATLDILFDADCDNNLVSQITTVNVSGGVPPYSIVWSSGDVSGANNETMVTSTEGTVFIEITDSLGCVTEVPFEVELFEIGIPGFEYTSIGVSECETLGVGDPITFTNTSTGDYINVTWDFGETGIIFEGDIVTYTYNEPGTYVVTQTVEYPYGCIFEYTEIIEITVGYGIVLPNAFTPNSDGINDTIRPWYKCMSNIEISIYDTWGSLLYVETSDGDLRGWDGTINGKEAENGNYIIVVRAITLFGESIELNGPVALIR